MNKTMITMLLGAGLGVDVEWGAWRNQTSSVSCQDKAQQRGPLDWNFLCSFVYCQGWIVDGVSIKCTLIICLPTLVPTATLKHPLWAQPAQISRDKRTWCHPLVLSYRTFLLVITWRFIHSSITPNSPGVLISLVWSLLEASLVKMEDWTGTSMPLVTMSPFWEALPTATAWCHPLAYLLCPSVWGHYTLHCETKPEVL